MKYFFAGLILMSVICFHYNCTDSLGKDELPNNNIKKAGIVASLPINYIQKLHSGPEKKNPRLLEWMILDDIGMTRRWDFKQQRMSKGDIEWMIRSEKPFLLRTAFMQSAILINPGDSIHITWNEKNGFSFSGNGADAIRLQYEIEQAKQSLVSPTRTYIHIESQEDYLNWMRYLDKQLRLIIPILDAYEGKLSPGLHDTIKIRAIHSIEHARIESFLALNGKFGRNKLPGLTQADVTAIYDSTILSSSWSKWLQSCQDDPFDKWYYYLYNRLLVQRKYEFNLAHDSLNTSEKQKLAYYRSIEQNLHGALREKLFLHVLTEKAIKEMGFNPTTEYILKDYYSQPGFPEYKQWMKTYEDSARRIYLAKTRSN